jgi:two-component system CheB/CheR fusion protein
VHPKDRPEVERQFQNAVTQQKDLHFECRVVWPDGSVHWISAHGSIYRASGGKPTHMLGIVANIDERKQAESQTALLMGELDHRVRNILAIISAVIRQTLKTSPSPGAFATDMEGRIAAIARAHSLLTQKSGRREASLRDLITTELAPYESGDGNLVINSTGADVALTPKSGLALAMAIHELASNAAKYGALSAAAGRLTVTWEIVGAGENRMLNLVWTETGGPSVQPPSRRGFGTILIEQTLSQEFDATVSPEFLESGLRCTIEIPLTDEVGHLRIPDGDKRKAP